MNNEDYKNMLAYNIQKVSKIMFKPHSNYVYDRNNLMIVSEDTMHKIILYKAKIPFEDYDFTISQEEMEEIYRIRLEILRNK